MTRLKLFSVYRSYPIDILISSARLPTAGLGSNGAGALILVRAVHLWFLMRRLVLYAYVVRSYKLASPIRL